MRILKLSVLIIVYISISIPDFAREKVIIGIHGIGNKPPKDTLTQWWKLSIKEGLDYNSKSADYNLKLAYWADLLNPLPFHNDPEREEDALFNTEPYLPATELMMKSTVRNWFKKLIDKELFMENRTAFFNAITPDVSDDFTFYVLQNTMKDISSYFSDKLMIKNRKGKEEIASKVIDDELKATLLKEQDKDIMLIAHSLGSVVAYNVLNQLAREKPGLKISYLVTIGSALAIPPIQKFMRIKVYKTDTLRVPGNVGKGWYNMCDRHDGTCINCVLNTVFRKNSHNIDIEDIIVVNNYLNIAGKTNYHKEYGYLRTPEIAEIIFKFLKE